ncbi:MAG: MAPEG family protein [Rhizobiales bacterium]|nr:MAPEG family protein [Hyphomicrobiales bacterium]
MIGFIAWTLALLVLMETIRTCLVVTGKVPANGFTPDNRNLSPFMQRLARAHANCLEGLPIFGGLLIFAIIVGATAVMDGLALWLLGARFAQSTIHLLSTSVAAVSARFTALAVQMLIGIYWIVSLL